jgi:protoheme IX farnesyltransferase
MIEMVKNYALAAKPGIVLGNMAAAAGGFLLASRGCVDWTGMLWTVSGICLIVASGCVLNNLVDRGTDRIMTRTRNRVLAKGLISPKAALAYASILGTAGGTALWTATHPLSVAIAAAGFVVYVGLYSLYLKPRSVHATLIGSMAGAAPPLAGYCAVTHGFDGGAAILLLIFILWQVPHSYAIAVFRFEDYAAANIPALPVKRGLRVAKRQIRSYIAAFLAASLLLTFCGYTGCGYLAVTAVVGLYWLRVAWSDNGPCDDFLWGRKLFIVSILNISALSVMMAVDSRTPVAATVSPSLCRGGKLNPSGEQPRAWRAAPLGRISDPQHPGLPGPCAPATY